MIAFGKVTVTTGGTPVRATAALSDPTARIAAAVIRFTALPGNTGLIYIQRIGTGDDRTNLVRTVAILGAPTSATVGMSVQEFRAPADGNSFNIADYMVDAGVNGNGVLISYMPR